MGAFWLVNHLGLIVHDHLGVNQWTLLSRCMVVVNVRHIDLPLPHGVEAGLHQRQLPKEWARPKRSVRERLISLLLALSLF